MAVRKTPARTVAALAGVLDLDGQIPWDTTELLADYTAPPVPPISLVLASAQTVRQMIDAMPEPKRSRKLEECAAYGIALDEPDETGWTVHRPRRDSTFFAPMNFDQWVAYEASKLPAGYTPVRLTADEQRRRDFGSARRDAAIRQALTDGVPVADLVTQTGLSRARIYQIRDHRR